MKTLIIRNFVTDLSWGQQTIDSFSENIKQDGTSGEVDICSALEGQEIPDLDKYDLVILTGGKYDLLAPNISPWVETLLGKIQKLSSGNHRTKLLGICWGHQAINFALGGTLELIPEGPQIGVQDITLTPLGQEFFGRESLTLLKYHKRRVVNPAPVLQHLGDNNEIFMSESKKIITFQGHPEMTYQIAKGLMDGDDGSYAVTAAKAGSKPLKGIEASHDGLKVWKDLVKWANP